MRTASDVLVDGARLEVREWPGRGRPLLLLHGLASSSHIFDLVAPRLAPQFRVVAYDQRGHGRSGKPASGYDFDRVAADCFAVVKSLGLDRPVVVGHSWGANVALEVAVQYPAAIAGAVLVDGGLVRMRDRLTWEEVEERLAPPPLHGMRVRDFVETMRGMLEPHLVWRPALEQIALSFVTVNGDGRIRPRLSRTNHLRILRALWEQDPPALLRRVTVPALVLACRQRWPKGEEAERQRMKEEAAEEVRAAGGSARVAWIDAIHDVPLQRPAALAARLRDFARTL